MARSLIAAAVAAFLLTGCGASAPTHEPTVYVLSDDVIADLAGGGYATVTIGLQVRSGLDAAEAQSGIVREIVTNDLTGIDRRELLDHARRDDLKLKLARDIRRRTDISLDGVLLTDITLR